MILCIPYKEYVSFTSVTDMLQHNFNLTREAALNLYTAQLNDIVNIKHDGLHNLTFPFSTGPKGIQNYKRGMTGINIRYVMTVSGVKIWNT